MIAVWDNVLGRRIEWAGNGNGVVRGVLVAVVMQTVSTAEAGNGVQLGETMFVFVDEHGVVHEELARRCRFATSFQREARGGEQFKEPTAATHEGAPDRPPDSAAARGDAM